MVESAAGRLEDSLEKEMATHFSILAWRIPWTEKPAGPHSMGLQRVRHNWAANTFTFIVILILTEALRNCLYTWHTLLDSHCRVGAQFPLGSQESITSANTVTPFFVCWFRCMGVQSGWLAALTSSSVGLLLCLLVEVLVPLELSACMFSHSGASISLQP